MRLVHSIDLVCGARRFVGGNCRSDFPAHSPCRMMNPLPFAGCTPLLECGWPTTETFPGKVATSSFVQTFFGFLFLRRRLGILLWGLFCLWAWRAWRQPSPYSSCPAFARSNRMPTPAENTKAQTSVLHCVAPSNATAPGRSPFPGLVEFASSICVSKSFFFFSNITICCSTGIRPYPCRPGTRSWKTASPSLKIPCNSPTAS